MKFKSKKFCCDYDSIPAIKLFASANAFLPVDSSVEVLHLARSPGGSHRDGVIRVIPAGLPLHLSIRAISETNGFILETVTRSVYSG
jgi:hypothetical protein